MEDFYSVLPRTEEEYLQTRVLDQIKWFDKKSTANKKSFITLKVLEIILALTIPFLTGYITKENLDLKLLVGIIGIVVAIITSIVTLVKYQENWIQYRTVAESLKKEKFLFLARTGPYKEGNAFTTFVERFESLISDSNTKWVSYIVSNKNPDKNGENK